MFFLAVRNDYFTSSVVSGTTGVVVAGSVGTVGVVCSGTGVVVSSVMVFYLKLLRRDVSIQEKVECT